MSREISDDEYTRQTQSLCDCYNKELSNRMTVLFSLRMTSKLASRHKISPLHDEYTRQKRTSFYYTNRGNKIVFCQRNSISKFGKNIKHQIDDIFVINFQSILFGFALFTLLQQLLFKSIVRNSRNGHHLAVFNIHDTF